MNRNSCVENKPDGKDRKDYVYNCYHFPSVCFRNSSDSWRWEINEIANTDKSSYFYTPKSKVPAAHQMTSSTSSEVGHLPMFKRVYLEISNICNVQAAFLSPRAFHPTCSAAISWNRDRNKVIRSNHGQRGLSVFMYWLAVSGLFFAALRYLPYWALGDTCPAS